MFNTALFKELWSHDVRYLLCGGLAVNLYGIPRMTADIDVLVDFTAENLARFEEAVKKAGFERAIPLAIEELLNLERRKELIKERNLIAYSYSDSHAGGMALDVLVDVPVDFQVLWDQKETRETSFSPIFLVSLADLIVLKKYANRIQDRDDILQLKKFIK